eukprot:TRINITY_DN62789_c0_g1_i1.p1 TRINITY_DN62789_c0_g1~~TRINITY_DN62789_c0_g1_i1.p1  ORF type:complete len:284 (+),score=44.10 TRINITY_DN62789_c0_g1_i1:75-926(+)
MGLTEAERHEREAAFVSGERGTPMRLRLTVCPGHVNAKALRTVAEAARGVCPELNFDCSSRGIASQVVDRDHTALLAIRLEPSVFSEYECPRPVAFGVSADWLSQELGKQWKGHALDISVSSDRDHLSLRSIGENGTEIESRLKLLDLDSEFLGVPDRAYTAEALMPVVDLRKLFSGLSEFAGRSATYVRISATAEGTFIFAVDGDGVTARETRRSAGATHISVTEPCHGIFSIGHLASFANAIGESRIGVARLGLADGNPLSIEYAPWGGGSRLQLILAPRT